MEEGPANWANVELANLDTSLAILQDVIAQEAANKRQRRGYKPKKTISREDAQADVENDLNIVINHMFNITDPRPHLSVDQTLAVLRLLRKIDEFENSTITKDDFDKEFKTAMTALDGVDRGPCKLEYTMKYLEPTVILTCINSSRRGQ